MKNLKKFGVALLVVATMGSTALFASNTSDSTGGTIYTDADKYLDLNYFNEVNFEKMFLETNLSDNNFQFGGATKKNDFYFAGRYAGNFWGKLSGSSATTTKKETGTDYSESTTEKNNENKVIGKELWENGDTVLKNKHDFSLLFGLKNMGFTLNSTLNFYKDSKVSSNPYEGSGSYEGIGSGSDVRKPSINNKCNNEYYFDLGWGGMNLNLKNAIAKPFVNLTLNFVHHNEYTKSETVNKGFDNNKTIQFNTVSTVETKDNENNDFSLGLYFGSDFVWGKDSPLMQVLTVQNGMAFDITPDEYFSSKTTTVDKVNDKTTTNLTTKTRLDSKYFADIIFAKYRVNYKPTEKLTLGLNAALQTSFVSIAPGLVQSKETTEEGTKDITLYYSDGNLVDTADKYSTSYFTTEIFPYFSLGLSYAVKPNFTLNLGYSGYLPLTTIENTTTKNTKTTADYVRNSETKTSDVQTGDYSRWIATGFKWDLTNNCTLDVSLGLGGDGYFKPSFDNIWNAGWNLGFTFKK